MRGAVAFAIAPRMHSVLHALAFALSAPRASPDELERSTTNA
jgi:hypothetical protein